jgi:glucan 1,3-beta-glucosidase
VLKALKWARKYGIRINFDLHTLPGSQNGWNHSGRIGEVNWLRGAMGLANAQRALEIIRTLTQFIVQPEYASLIPLWGFVNEPNANVVGQGPVGSFYYEVYRMIREITGTGEGNGPMLSMHDGFVGLASWYDFMPGGDRMALDQHPYMCFGDQRMGDLSVISQAPCEMWAVATNETSRRFGANTAGEWSAAINDCGQWLNRVGAGARYEGAFPGYNGPTAGPGGCDYWNDHRLWDANTKAELLNVVTRSMDALQVSNHFSCGVEADDRTTFSGHGRLEIRLVTSPNPTPCGTTDLDYERDGSHPTPERLLVHVPLSVLPVKNSLEPTHPPG